MSGVDQLIQSLAKQVIALWRIRLWSHGNLLNLQEIAIILPKTGKLNRVNASVYTTKSIPYELFRVD
jgi:hypothetical protein